MKLLPNGPFYKGKGKKGKIIRRNNAQERRFHSSERATTERERDSKRKQSKSSIIYERSRQQRAI